MHQWHRKNNDVASSHQLLIIIAILAAGCHDFESATSEDAGELTAGAPPAADDAY